MERNGIEFVDVSEGDWRRLRGAWLDMVGSRCADDLETLDDALALTEAEWRRRARELTKSLCRSLCISSVSLLSSGEETKIVVLPLDLDK